MYQFLIPALSYPRTTDVFIGLIFIVHSIFDSMTAENKCTGVSSVLMQTSFAGASGNRTVK